MPAISVIMPVYNAANYLDDAMRSILEQTFTDFEFLIFNDGSTDNSAAIIRSYNDSRIKFIDNNFNQGYVALLNEGIKLSEGKYIARMDADDISAKERFEKQYAFMEQHPDYVLCGTRYVTIPTNEPGELPLNNDEIKLKMLYITPFCHPSVMFRSSTLSENNLIYSREHMPAEDHEMWVKLARFGKYHNLKDYLTSYRVHSNNISTKKRTEQQIKNLKQVQIDYLAYFFKNTGVGDKDIFLLHNLFYKDANWTIDELKRSGKLISIIINKNASYPVSASKIYKLLSTHLYYRCTTSTNLGLTAFFIANKYSFAHIPFKNNINLFIKSIIKYNAKYSI